MTMAQEMKACTTFYRAKPESEMFFLESQKSFKINYA